MDSGPSPWLGQRIQEELQLVAYPIPQKERRQNFMHGKDVVEGVTQASLICRYLQTIQISLVCRRRHYWFVDG
jgi:hypothetical protein